MHVRNYGSTYLHIFSWFKFSGESTLWYDSETYKHQVPEFFTVRFKNFPRINFPDLAKTFRIFYKVDAESFCTSLYIHVSF